MSLWEFRATVAGAAAARAGDDEALSSEQAEALAEWIDKPPVWH